MSKPQFGEYGEPWQELGTTGYADAKGRWLTPYDHRSRVLKCINACSGLSDEQLKRVRAVNELYQICKSIAEDNYGEEEWSVTNVNAALLEKAIARAEGKEVGE